MRQRPLLSYFIILFSFPYLLSHRLSFSLALCEYLKKKKNLSIELKNTKKIDKFISISSQIKKKPHTNKQNSVILNCPVCTFHLPPILKLTYNVHFFLSSIGREPLIINSIVRNIMKASFCVSDFIFFVCIRLGKFLRCYFLTKIQAHGDEFPFPPAEKKK